MPAVGEVEQHPGDSFWRSGSEEKGHRETSTLGKKKELTGAAVLVDWAGGDGAALSWGRAGAAQGSRGEGWGGLEQRGGAQQGGGRKWQAQCG
jgi:hypothetical protein